MKKASASILLGVILDVIFALIFFLLLSQWSLPSEKITIHMNQIGMYKEIKNSETTIQKLNNIGLKGYCYEKDDLFIVVTSFYFDKNESLKEQKILKENQIKFILKEVSTSDEVFIKAVKEKNMDKVMELMSNKS